MTCADDGGVVFVLKSSGTKVDQPDFWIQKDAPLWNRAGGAGLGGGYTAIVGEGLV
jgi:hypothetical protein